MERRRADKVPRLVDNGYDQPIEKIGADHDPFSDAGNGADNAPITATDNAGTTSNRHKCWHCDEHGETLEVLHGTAKTRLHRECIDVWIIDYEERVG